MREIKFRGKRLDNGEWLFGDLMHDNFGGRYIYPIECDNLYKKNAVLPETVGQFTGLRDYDGKEIFEGDIVKCCYMIPEWGWSGGAEEKEEEVIGAVEYRRGDFCIGEYPIVSFQGDEMEVIGNIYDNSELLKNL